MHNFTDNMIRDARNVQAENEGSASMNDSSANQQKVITFKDRDYLLYEGRIIDEAEADRIYT
jgi:hypothetical protein